MITLEHDQDDFLICRVSGILSKADYDAALPEIENALVLRQGALRLMILLEDFRGWEARALWEELRFDIKHGRDFGRVAIVGESRLEECLTFLSKPFFGAEIRYFNQSERTAACDWLTRDGES